MIVPANYKHSLPLGRAEMRFICPEMFTLHACYSIHIGDSKGDGGLAEMFIGGPLQVQIYRPCLISVCCCNGDIRHVIHPLPTLTLFIVFL